MVSDVLLFGALLLIGLKLGLGTRLREIGRTLDRLVNILLVLIVGAYAIQLVVAFFMRS